MTVSLLDMPPEVVWQIIAQLGFYHYALALGLANKWFASVVFCRGGTKREQNWAKKKLMSLLDTTFCSLASVRAPWFSPSATRPKTVDTIIEELDFKPTVWDFNCLESRVNRIDSGRGMSSRGLSFLYLFAECLKKLTRETTEWLLMKGYEPWDLNRPFLECDVLDFKKICDLKKSNWEVFATLKVWYGNSLPSLYTLETIKHRIGLYITEELISVRVTTEEKKELAKMWRISPYTIRKWRREGGPVRQISWQTAYEDYIFMKNEKDEIKSAWFENAVLSLPACHFPSPAELARHYTPSRIRRVLRPDRSRWGAPRPRRVFAGE